MSTVKTPIHKIELYVAELNSDYGLDDMKLVIEQALDDHVTQFGDCQTRYHEIEEDEVDSSFWNFANTPVEEFRKFFSEDATSSASKEEH